MATLENFDKFADAVCANYKQNKTVFYKCFDDGRLLSLAEFYRNIQKQEDVISNEANRKEDKCSDLQLDIEFFAKALKSLDEYPSNLQKQKKSLAGRERLNSCMHRRTASLTDVSNVNNNVNAISQSSFNLGEIDQTPSIVDTFADFRKFEKQLQQLNATITENENDKHEYIERLQQLKSFAMHLNKIFPKENTAEAALNAKQEETLSQISKEIEDVNYMHSVSNISQILQCNKSNNIDDISNVLLFCTEAANILNIN